MIQSRSILLVPNNSLTNNSFGLHFSVIFAKQYDQLSQINEKKYPIRERQVLSLTGFIFESLSREETFDFHVNDARNFFLPPMRLEVIIESPKPRS